MIKFYLFQDLISHYSVHSKPSLKIVITSGNGIHRQENGDLNQIFGRLCGVYGRSVFY